MRNSVNAGNLGEDMAESLTRETLPAERRKVVPQNPFIPFERTEIEQSLCRRFEKQVVKYGERTAVRSRSCQLTYAELNRAANRVARAILALRGEGGEQIALLFEHGAAAVIGLMGVLKAGKCCVPVDPLYPRPRIQYVLEDSQPSVIVTNSRNHALAAELAGARTPVINIDELDARVSDANLNLSISPDSRHAIYYTSGTTGRPKGVIRVHRNTLHGILNQTNAYHTCPEDRIGLTASQCFAASATDTFSALLNGACLLPFDLNAEGLGNLAKWLAGEEISIFHPVPTLFRNFAAWLPKDRRFPKVRLILFGGETICKRDIQLYKEHFSDRCLLRCGYSVTEANGGPTLMLIDQQTEIAGNIVPAGYVMSDKEIWILDENKNRVGCNQVGEIAVRSRYLSPGYWRKPELTQAVFLPDPKGGDARIYLTGDLGRLSPDGCLEHLGRKDMQVKIRGVRIELAEVEAVLLDIPQIKEAAVVAREDAHGDKRLVAYVVAREEPSLPVGTLRAALLKSLPAQGVPAAFVFLDSLPQTPNGKVDRRALPAPSTARPALDGECRAARNPVEERLTRLWEEVLGVKPIGVQDNFFELGGDSLSAVRLVARLEEAFGKSLPLHLLLQAPTIERLAAALEENGWDRRGAFLVEIQSKGSQLPLFCVHPVNTHIFVHLARRLGPEQPCYGLHLFGLAPARKPRVVIEPLASRYLDEIRKVQPEGPYFLCGLCAGGVVAFEMAQQLKARGEEVAFLALLDTFGPGGHAASRTRPVAFSAMRRRLNRELFHPAGEFIAHQLRRSAKHACNLSKLTLDGQMAYIRQLAARRAARVQAAPAPIEHAESERRQARYLQQLNRYTMALLHANGNAARRYRPRAYQGRPILFLATETTETPRHGSRLAWRELATGGAEVYTVPGLHHHILSEPNVSVLAKYFKAHLEEAQKSEHRPRT